MPLRSESAGNAHTKRSSFALNRSNVVSGVRGFERNADLPAAFLSRSAFSPGVLSLRQ